MTAEQRNIELARRLFAAFGARDVVALREVVHPDGELKSILVELEGADEYRGHEGIERYLADISDAFEEWHTEDERFVPVGGDKVICVYRVVGRGAGSGAPIDTEMAIVWSVRDELLCVGRVFADPEQALAEAQ